MTGQLQMASLSLYAQFETNLMSNRKVSELPLQLKNTKVHGKSYIKDKPHPVRPSFALMSIHPVYSFLKNKT